MKKLLMISAALAAATLSSAKADDAVLNIYNWSDYIAEDTLEKFTEATGIKVVYDVYDSNEVLEAKLLAGRSGYDLVVPTSEYLERQIKADIYMPLDKSKLPNLKNMDPGLMANASSYDANNEHSVIYMWGTTGIGYNVDMVKERLGDDFEVNSWNLIFDPDIVSKLADCGVTLLDAPNDMMSTALNYLGLDPNSSNKQDLAKAADLMKAVRPSIRYFNSSQYINDLANGDICVAVGYSGDVFQAGDRASEADNGVTVEYLIPREGALQWFDLMAIPSDAPNPDSAHRFINFVMDAQITADITNYVWYASANTAALPLIDPEIVESPGIFPPDDIKEKLWTIRTKSARDDRAVTRLWTEIKTGH